MKILKTLLNNEAAKKLIFVKDEGYENTPLHVACGLHSFVFTSLLIERGSDLTAKNSQGFTPEDVIKDEIKTYNGHLKTLETTYSLERLHALT